MHPGWIVLIALVVAAGVAVGIWQVVVYFQDKTESSASAKREADTAAKITEATLYAGDVAMGTVSIDDTYICSAWPNNTGLLSLPFVPYGQVGHTVTLVFAGLADGVTVTTVPSPSNVQLVVGVNTFTMTLARDGYADTVYVLRVTVAGSGSATQVSQVTFGSAFSASQLSTEGNPFVQDYTELPVEVVVVPAVGNAVAWAEQVATTRSTTQAWFDFPLVEGDPNLLQLLVTPAGADAPATVWTLTPLMKPNPARLSEIRVYDSDGTTRGALRETFSPVVNGTCHFDATISSPGAYLQVEWDQLDGDGGTVVTMTARNHATDDALTVDGSYRIGDLPDDVDVVLSCENGDFQVVYTMALSCPRPTFFHGWPIDNVTFADHINGTSGGTFNYTLSSGGHIYDMAVRMSLTDAVNLVFTYTRVGNPDETIGIYNFGSTSGVPATLALRAANYMVTTDVTLQAGDTVKLVISGTGFTYTATDNKPVLRIDFD